MGLAAGRDDGFSMNPKHRIRQVLQWLRNQKLLVAAWVCLLGVLALPVEQAFLRYSDFLVLGIPPGFLLKFALLPILAGWLLSLYVIQSEDNDRHNPEFENE